MKFSELIAIAGDEPVFSTGHLLVGDISPQGIRAQLSRWVSEGRLIMLRRGLYTIAPPYRTKTPSPFVVANALSPGSYVSCQSALSWHGVIPEGVEMVTSVTPGRPGIHTNPLGTFILRHIKPDLLWGYESVPMPGGGSARIALPEKALLDLLYLEHKGGSPAYIRQLRLSGHGELSAAVLLRFARRWGSPGMFAAAETVIEELEGSGQ